MISPFSPSQCRLGARSIAPALSTRECSMPYLSRSRCNGASVGRGRGRQQQQKRCDPRRQSSPTTTTVVSASATSPTSSSASSSASPSPSPSPSLADLPSLITPNTIVIVGAGIAGVATARALSLLGVEDFVVLERSAGPRAEGTSIGLWTNAWRALDALQVGDELRASWPRMRGVELFDSKGKKLREIAIDDCAGAPHEARGVGRAALVRALAEKIPKSKMAFGCTVVSVKDVSKSNGGGGSSNNDIGSVELEVEGLASPLRCRALVAADGARSTLVQKAILNSSSASSSSSSSSALLKPLRYVGYTAYRGIAAFPVEKVPPMLPRESFRVLFGAGVRTGIVPLGVHRGGVAAISGGGEGGDSSEKDDGGGEEEALFYWFSCQNEPRGDTTRITDVSEMRADAARVVSSGWDLRATGVGALQEASADATWSRAAIADRWLESGKSYGVGAVTAVGDAAHPMTPNAGQGGCVGLEDAVELARAFKKGMGSGGGGGERGGAGGVDLSTALREFEATRATRARQVQLKSFAIGFVGQLNLPLFPAFRDLVLSSVYPIEQFLDLAEYDCGGL